jgi:hypothetical protein
MLEPPDLGTLFEAPDLQSQVAVLRRLVRRAAGSDPAALQLLVAMLPAVDTLLADVQAVLARLVGMPLPSH